MKVDLQVGMPSANSAKSGDVKEQPDRRRGRASALTRSDPKSGRGPKKSDLESDAWWQRLCNSCGPMTGEDLEVNLNVEDDMRAVLQDTPVHALPWKGDGGGYTRVRSVIDSGAGETVAPPVMAPHVPIRQSEDSKRGQHLVSASKQRLPNMGEQVIHAMTNDYKNAPMTLQIAEVSRPLTSVANLCDKNKVVIFGQKGGVIVSLLDGQQTRFERAGGIYEMDLWLPDGAQDESGFPGRACSVWVA